MPAMGAPVNLLWTGGWDSTYRLLDALVVEGQTVQPYYVIDPARLGFPAEIRAMVAIREALVPRVGDRLLPVKIFMRPDIPADAATTRRFNALVGRAFLGGQYDWLSRLALWQQIEPLELAVHRDDRAYAFVQLHHAVEQDARGHYRLKPVVDDALEVFRPFAFPILHLTKIEMGEAARRHGFADLLEQTWFCHEPDRRGRACGACNACRYTINEGLARRIPSVNRARYRARHLFLVRLARRVWRAGRQPTRDNNA
jgi:hypothetical protein